MDSSILGFLIILSGFFCVSPSLYPRGVFVDDVLDFLGSLVAMSGIFLRMAARGHKMQHSQNGNKLVISGPYRLVRNPMYLGSFLMGLGFVLIIWPWWGGVVFTGIFYLRFKRQIDKEEAYLSRKFGKMYLDYSRKIPPIFPAIKNLRRINFKETFPFKELWSNSEKLGILAWPVIAVALEVLQQRSVYGIVDISHTTAIFALAVSLFALFLWVIYKYQYE